MSSQSKTDYKAIPITLFGVKYYDKILYGKMFMIDLHFHNIYRNYRKYKEIIKKEYIDSNKSDMKDFEREYREGKKNLKIKRNI